MSDHPTNQTTEPCVASKLGCPNPELCNTRGCLRLDPPLIGKATEPNGFFEEFLNVGF